MIGEITASPEVGKTYLGKVTRLAEFGAFVEILPGTDGLLHISEVAEHRIKDVKDELKEGDQVLVKVLAVEGNRIKLSRKAVLKEQRAKLAQPDGGHGGDGHEEEHGEVVAFEGGAEDADVGEVASDEPNFNREGMPVEGRRPHGGGERPHGGGGGSRRRRPGGGGRGPRGPRGGR